MSQLAKPGKRKLVLDGDGSQYMESGLPCSMCGKRAEAGEAPVTVFIRVREKLASGGTRHHMLVCPDCVARLFLQVARLDLWSQVSATVAAAIRRLFSKRYPGNVAERPRASAKELAEGRPLLPEPDEE